MGQIHAGFARYGGSATVLQASKVVTKLNFSVFVHVFRPSRQVIRTRGGNGLINAPDSFLETIDILMPSDVRHLGETPK